MSRTVSVQQAAHELGELISSLGPGDEIVLTQDDHPVARIVPSAPRRQRQPGNCRGMLVIRKEDDEHIEDFEGDMP